MSQDPRRLPNMTYAPRVVLFGYAGAAVLWATHELYAWLPLSLLLALQFVVWPQLAYLRARFSRDPKRAEYTHIALDAFLLGLWVGVGHYLVSILLLLLGISALTHLSLRGGRGFARAVFLFTLGGMVGGAVTGFQVRLDGSAVHELIGFGGILLAMFIIGFNAFRQNRVLLGFKRSIEAKTEIFEALLKLGLLTRQTTDVESLLSRSLGYFKELMPDLGFAILLHDTKRPRSIRHMHLVGLPEASTDSLIAQVCESSAEGDRFDEPQPGGFLSVLPMKAHLTQLEGYLVIKGEGVLNADRRAAIRLFRDQVATALESSLLTLQLQRLASTDPLTGVYNRAYLQTAFERAVIAKESPAGVDFTLIAIDLNGLKATNDALGHGVGDAMVVAAADMLVKIARDSDALVRMGGDEFMLLCSPCNSVDALGLVERIRTSASATTVATTESRQGACLRLSLSIGHASSDEIPLADLAITADQRMYEDKNAFYQLNLRYR